jgi:hypothetical protein
VLVLGWVELGTLCRTGRLVSRRMTLMCIMHHGKSSGTFLMDAATFKQVVKAVDALGGNLGAATEMACSMRTKSVPYAIVRADYECLRPLSSLTIAAVQAHRLPALQKMTRKAEERKRGHIVLRINPTLLPKHACFAG